MLALGADHAGWQREEEIKAWLLERNAELLDFGPHDYPLEPALLMKGRQAGGAGGAGSRSRRGASRD